VRRQLVAQTGLAPGLQAGELLAQTDHLTRERLELLLLPGHGAIEFLEEIVGEAGLHLQIHEALIGTALPAHAGLTPGRSIGR
jgi:hypothetical protein